MFGRIRVPLALLAALTVAGPVVAQQPQLARPGAPSAGQCINNLKQIGLGLHNQARPTQALAAGRHHVEMCASAAGPFILNIVDGTSNTALISEAPVRLSGCPADLETFGDATVRTRERADGATEVVLSSSEHRGCTATALLLPAVQKVREAAARPDTRRVSPATREAYRTFWQEQSRAEAATLERRLQALAARAERGQNVDRELAQLRREKPRLFALARQLEQEPLVLVGPGGEEPLSCIGIGYIASDGSFVCIGVLTT